MFIVMLFAIVATTIGAQNAVHVWKGGICLTFTANDVDSITFDDTFSPIGDTHEYVDLGLPSGTLWATCNVGASKPEEIGGYYAWGETYTKSYYEWDTYKYYSSSKIAKYCTDSSYGAKDDLTVLSASDDAATVNWGSKWRMPTVAECKEIAANVTFEWTIVNGVYGGRLTSIKNGKSLFFPAAGAKYESTNFEFGASGYYWTSELDTNSNRNAYGIFFSSNDASFSESYSRRYGGCVRAVRK